VTPPVKPSRRRAANLVTTFTADEVRLMLKACDAWIATDEYVLGGPEEHVLVSAQKKFLRLRDKARSGS
jgi:hypothetical protein